MVAYKVNLEQKYQALLDEAQRRALPDMEGVRLCFQTLSLARAIDRECATLLGAHGLTEGRFILLFLLDAAPEGLAPHVLAAQAGVTRATVTGLLDGLARDALIAREADSQDRRALRIRLTAEGRHLASTVFAQHSQWIAGLFGHLSADECQQLTRLLGKAAAPLGATQRATTP